MTASVTPGRALRYAEGSARGLLHHFTGHYPARCTGSARIAPSGWTSSRRVQPFEPSPGRFDPFGNGPHRVLVTVRPKYACRACTDGVRQAPAPAALIEG